MAVAKLGNSESRLEFFQQRIVHAIEHWASHEAVQKVEVKVLDLKRETILRAIALGLDFEPAWPIVKRLIIAFTPYMERRGYWDVWHGVLQQAIGVAQTISVAQTIGDVETETTLTALLARLCQRMSRPDDVVRHYRRVIRLARRTGNEYELARACSNLGYLYIDRGQWWRSEVLSKHALAIFEELGSDHGRAHTYNHLGLLYSEQDSFEKAIEHLASALELWRGLNDSHSQLHGLISLSDLYLRVGRAEDAITQLTDAEQLCLITGEEALRADVLMNTGRAYRDLGDLGTALPKGLEAERIYRKFRNNAGLAGVYNNLALVRGDQGDFEESLRLFLESLSLHRQLNDHVSEANLLADIIDHHLKVGNRNEAMKCLLQLEDVVNNTKAFPNYHGAIAHIQEIRRNLVD